MSRFYGPQNCENRSIFVWVIEKIKVSRFLWPTFSLHWYRRAFTRYGASNKCGVGKTSYFRAKYASISLARCRWRLLHYLKQVVSLSATCFHVELEQFLACFRVARVCQRQLGLLVNLWFPICHQRLSAPPILPTTDIVRVTNFCIVLYCK